MGRLMVGGSGSGRVAEGLGLGWVVGAKRQGWGRMGQDLSCRPPRVWDKRANELFFGWDG